MTGLPGFDVCRCGHFVSSHGPAECWGVHPDDHSVRCACGGPEVLPPVGCRQCGGRYLVHDRVDDFGHCDDHGDEWEPA